MDAEKKNISDALKPYRIPNTFFIMKTYFCEDFRL